MNKNGAGVIGFGLIIIGILSILVNFNVIDIEFWEFWPFFILVIGLVFEIGYFSSSKKEPGLLVPAGILITISGIFITNIVFGWYMMEYLWPLFIMAPGIGLLQLFLFSKKKEIALLIPIGISLLLGTYFLLGIFFYFIDFLLFISVVVILVGLLLVFRKGPERITKE